MVAKKEGDDNLISEIDFGDIDFDTISLEGITTEDVTIEHHTVSSSEGHPPSCCYVATVVT